MPRQRNEELLRMVGARLQQLRKRRGWTQEALAEAIDIQPVTLSRYETGDRPLSLTVLARASGALDVGLGDLLDVSRDAPEPDSSIEELELLRLWHGLDAERQDLALRLLREVSRR